MRVSYLRNLIGVVSQEPVLFDATLEENIEFGRLDVTTKEIIQACKLSNAHDFISKLPDGYKTKVGERGVQMSGGQKQRIAIARALVRDPKILLLDEATSALDAESESIVQQALEKAAQGRTTLIIAHRLSTIRNADKIIALKDGVIKETGTHSELMEKKGLYHTLVTSQMFQDAAFTSDYVTESDPNVHEDDEAHSRSRQGSLHRQPSHHPPRRLSRNLERAISLVSGVTDYSDEGDVEETSNRRRRMLSTKLDTEEERIKRELAEEGASKSAFIEISKHSRPEWPMLFGALICAVIQGFAMPVFSVIYNQIFLIYSAADPQVMIENSKLAAVAFAIFGVIYGISWIGSMYWFTKSGERLTMRLRLKVFKNILRQDVAYFDDSRHSTGKICTRLATDAPNVKSALDFRLGGLIEAILSVIAGVAIAFIFGWQLALLVVGILPLAALGAALEMKVRDASVKRDAQLLEEAGKTASEAIDSIRTVQALTREKEFFSQFCAHLDAPFAHAMKQAHVHAIAVAYAYSINFFAYAASFAFGAYLVRTGALSPLMIMMVVLPISFSTFGIGYATTYFPEYFKARMSAGLIFKMLDVEPKIDSTSTAGLKPDVRGLVSFKDVHFSYPSRAQVSVLNGLSWNLDPGRTLALVGPSGCGKSTVVNLMERFYDPNSGQIMLDDYDLRTVNPAYMRQLISLVSQEPVLFDCSIRENIMYGLNDVSKERIEDAAKLANIHNFILSLPEAYETRVGEKGTQLSGGQKQRVAIARALVRQPRILLLDEATSALDTESEKIVQEALDKAREGRTCIIIAHRLSTVQSADQIIVVRQGKVVEEGTHASLIAKKGAYYELTKKQNLEE